MVETIVPVVHGGKRSRYWAAVALHTVGALAAAAAVGAVLGALGSMLDAPWGAVGPVALALIAAAYVLRELVGFPAPVPQLRRQVPDWWRTFFSPRTAALLYGFGLGVGFATFLGFGTFAVVAAGALVSGDPLLGAALCAPFGLARGLSVAITGRARSGEAVSSVVDRVQRVGEGSTVRSVNLAALAAVGLAAVLAAV